MVHFCSVGAFQGVQQSLLHQQSKRCSSYSVGAVETTAPPKLRQVHPLKKNPNRGEPPLGFSFICVFRYLLNKHLLRCAIAHLNNVDALLRSRELLAVERVVLLLINLA